jgi:hypothetical protein
MDGERRVLRRQKSRSYRHRHVGAPCYPHHMLPKPGGEIPSGGHVDLSRLITPPETRAGISSPLKFLKHGVQISTKTKPNRVGYEY